LAQPSHAMQSVRSDGPFRGRPDSPGRGRRLGAFPVAFTGSLHADCRPGSSHEGISGPLRPGLSSGLGVPAQGRRSSWQDKAVRVLGVWAPGVDLVVTGAWVFRDTQGCRFGVKLEGTQCHTSLTGCIAYPVCGFSEHEPGIPPVSRLSLPVSGFGTGVRPQVPGYRVRFPAFGSRPSAWTKDARRSYLPRPLSLHGRGPSQTRTPG
jgi:hypothetical protein